MNQEAQYSAEIKILAAFLYLPVLLLHHILLLPPRFAGLEVSEQEDKALPCSAAPGECKKPPQQQ